MSRLESLAERVTSIATGLVAAFGAPSAPAVIVRSSNDTEALALVREGYKVERLAGRELHFTAHTVERLAGLLALTRGATEVSHILLGADTRDLTLAVKALLCPTDAAGSKVSAFVRPEPHLLAWLTVLAKDADDDNAWLTAKDLHALLRTSGHIIADPEPVPEVETIPVVDQLLNQVAKAKYVAKSEVKVELGRNGQTLARGMAGDTEFSVAPPEWITLRSPVWAEVVHNGEPITYDFDLIVDMDAGKTGVIFRLRCPELDVVRRRAEDDACDFIESQYMDDGVQPVVAVGTPVMGRAMTSADVPPAPSAIAST